MLLTLLLAEGNNMDFPMDKKISDTAAEEILRKSIDFIKNERCSKVDIESETLFIRFIEEKKYEFMNEIINVSCADIFNFPSITFCKNNLKYYIRFDVEKALLFNLNSPHSDAVVNNNDIFDICPGAIYFIDYLV